MCADCRVGRGLGRHISHFFRADTGINILPVEDHQLFSIFIADRNLCFLTVICNCLGIRSVDSFLLQIKCNCTVHGTCIYIDK